MGSTGERGDAQARCTANDTVPGRLVVTER
jgi:hypothetical protein